MPTQPLLLRPEEAAELLGISRSQTYKLISEGKLPRVFMGKSIRVPQAALEEHIRQATEMPEPPENKSAKEGDTAPYDGGAKEGQEPPLSATCPECPFLTGRTHNRTLRARNAPRRGRPEGWSPTRGEALAHCTVWESGTLVELQRVGTRRSGSRQGPPHGGGKRGAVRTVQSLQSRRELGRLLAQLDQWSTPMFVTLTIPEEHCPVPEELKRMQRNMERRLLRRFPMAACVVKREHHRSGVPHFHLLVWFGRGPLPAELVHDFQQWLPGAWCAVLGVPARVWMAEVRSTRRAAAYVSSHLWRGKGYQLDSQGVHWGRWWFVWNRDALPWSQCVTVGGDEVFFWRMHRAARHLDRLGKRIRPNASRVRFYEDDPRIWLRLALYYSGQASVTSLRDGLATMANRARLALEGRRQW